MVAAFRVFPERRFLVKPFRDWRFAEDDRIELPGLVAPALTG